MGIFIDLDVELAKRKMRLNELSERVGISIQNMSVLKSGRAKAIRFSTLAKICRVLGCQPGDILKYSEQDESDDRATHGDVEDDFKAKSWRSRLESN